jgi:hypothetical protein
VGHGGGVSQIVNSDHFHIGMLEGGPKDTAANTPETVDTDFYTHL